MLLYIHIGNSLPLYIIDSIYQAHLFTKRKIYVIVSDNLVNLLILSLKKINSSATVLKESDFLSESLEKYKAIIGKYQLEHFRDSFWISTTSRFFLISSFMKKFSGPLYHIETDVMIYSELEDLPGQDCIYMVKDSKDRVIPSILYITDYQVSVKLIDHIIENVKNEFKNDMYLLATFKNAVYFDQNIYDGACIGQYLGGVDYRNQTNILKEICKDNKKKLYIWSVNEDRFVDRLIDCENPVYSHPFTIYSNGSNVYYTLFHEPFTNPTRGFINETSDLKIKPNQITVDYENGLKIYKNNGKKVINLHIHSKDLYKFSSVFNVHFNNIISGDRIVQECDLILTTPDIDNFHILENKPERMYYPFKSISEHKKIFIYTHILDLYNPSESIEDKCFYIHNSDHPFEDSHYEKLKSAKRIFAQNINCSRVYDNLKLLPIGIANSMWPHGSIETLYKLMIKKYTFSKNKNIYINLDPGTFPGRKEFFEKNGIENNHPRKPFPEYLEDLRNHRFSLCLRGNGIDTHRFWESLYLKTIPVIMDTEQNFIKYLKNVPVVILKEFPGESYFSKELYDSLWVNVCDELMLSHYI